MFQKASRLKLRFPSSVGSLSVEDLWDLPLKSTANKPCLDDIAKKVYSVLESDVRVSFVDDVETSDVINNLRLDILKAIIAVRKEENKAALESIAKRNREQHLLSVLAHKKDEELMGKTAEEIEAMINAL